MTDPSPIADRTDAVEYRPLSGLALAGFGLALLFALGLAFPVAIALATRVPLLLDPLVLIVPLAAFVVSLLGWRQVICSEGTRSGEKLARWGMLISAVAGLGYLDWRLTKELALRHESQPFVDAWLDRLRRDQPLSVDSCIAFWYTLDTPRRDPRWPLHEPGFEKELRDDPGKLKKLHTYLGERYSYAAGKERAKLPAFLDHDLVQLLQTGGTEARFEGQGIRSWSYSGGDKGSFDVVLNYEVATPEGTFPAMIMVRSTDGEHGRQWQVMLEGTGIPAAERRLTPLGEHLQALRFDGREFARDWLRKLAQGMHAEVYLGTRKPAERGSLSPQVAALQTGNIATAAAGGPGLISLPWIADSSLIQRQLLSASLIDSRTFLADPEVETAIVPLFRGYFQAPEKPVIPVPTLSQDTWPRFTFCRRFPQEAMFAQPFTLRLPAINRWDGVICEGIIVVSTDDPAILNALDQPEAASLRLRGADRPDRWWIRSIELKTASVQAGKR